MPIDLTMLNLLYQIQPDDDPDFVTRMIKLYQTSTQSNISELQEAYESNNLEQLNRAAHSIKSTSANLGAMDLVKIAGKLENDCRQNNLANSHQQISEIIQEFERVCTYLNNNIQ